MFADSLLESARHRPSGRRSLSLLTSVAIEAIAIAVLIAIPIWHPDVLAAVTPHVIVTRPIGDYTQPYSGEHAMGGGGGVRGARSDTPIIRSFDPRGIYMGKPRGNDTLGDPTLPPGPNIGPNVGPDLFPNAKPVMPPLARKPQPLMLSHYDPGSIIRQVTPEYPATARIAHVQGEVVLQAVITRAGTIERLTVVSGHPLLVDAARDAVRQWRFRPYMLNGQAVEIETTITVKFQLDGSGGAV